MCHFYILYYGELDRYYVGHTCETLSNRLRSHLYEHGGFTGKAKDWKVVYSEEHDNKSMVYARERQVKSWKSRRMIEELICKDGEA